MKRSSHAHAREKLLAGVAKFPRTAAGRSMMREAYELSFMRKAGEQTLVASLDWDALAGKLSFALARRQ